MKISRLWLCLVLCAGCTDDTPPAIPPEARIAQLESSIVPPFVVRGEPSIPRPLEARMAQLGVPGVSIAVIEDGQLSWARGYGVADLDSGRKVTPETLFQAASISKPVAALGALRLVEQRRLFLDQDVNTVLTSWRLPEQGFADTEKVTLRNLLNHTAGTTVWGFPGYEDPDIPTTVEVLQGRGNTDAIELYKTPNESWRYSGGGYTVMQLMMADVTGVAFPELMQGLVLEPAGMANSRYEHPLSETHHAVAAHAYNAAGEQVAEGWHHYPELAAAGLWTTPSDLVEFALRIREAYRGARQGLLSRAAVVAMLAPGQNNWGLGPELAEDGNRFGHSGGNAGFRCQLWAYLDSGDGIVVMTNSDNGGRLMNEIIASAALIYDWPGLAPEEKVVVDLPAEAYDVVAGRYSLGVLGEIELAYADGRLTSEVAGRPVWLRPLSATRFFISDTGQELQFTTDNNRVTGVEVAGISGTRLD